MTASDRRLLAGILTVALLLRVGVALAWSAPLAGDAADYDRLAAGLAAGRGYVDTRGAPTAWRPPAYPAFLAVVSVLAVVVLLGAVVPRFKPIFAGTGKAVPAMTQAVLFAGDAMRNHGWLILIVLAVVGWLLLRRLKDPEVRYRFDRRMVTWPVVGDLFAKVEMARFSRTLGTLLSNGVTLVAALNIVRETMSNTWLAEAVGNVARELKEGRGLGRPMMETGRFPMLAVHMIQVGEETGRLDDMLMQVAETYDHEVEVAIRKALALLQPVMIVIMAAVIGFIIIAILSAMLSVYDLPI